VQLDKLREKIMTTNSTPAKLTDLKHQEFVFTAKQGEAPETIARKFFKDCFEFDGEPKLNHLFTEEGKRVYESYIDSGSVDYIYIIAE
jgi:hypothetical protein